MKKVIRTTQKRKTSKTKAIMQFSQPQQYLLSVSYHICKDHM